jgi:hypothetical protein
MLREKFQDFMVARIEPKGSCALLQNMELATKDENMRYLAFFKIR